METPEDNAMHSGPKKEEHCRNVILHDKEWKMMDFSELIKKLEMNQGAQYIIIAGRGYGKTVIAEELRELARIREEEHQREVMGIFPDDGLDGIRYAIESMLPSIEGLKEFGIELQEELDELGPSPAEIKKRLKYAKNPMEIKKLNQELTAAYKRYKGGSRNGIERR